MKLGIDMPTLNLETTLIGWERDQLPFATAKALTATGQRVKDAIRATMQVGFDRPTAYTLNATYMKPATKTNLICEVGIKNWASKGAPPTT